MAAPRFEVYEATDGWRWRLRAVNGEILASGEAHSSEHDARRAAFTIRETVPYAIVTRGEDDER